MAITRPILGLVSIILLAGGIVMQLLVILSGTHIGSPENQIFFLEADTSSISNSSSNYQNPARWTYFSICGVQDGLNYNCSAPTAALPFDPPSNFGTETGVPAAFIGTNRYYYLSRVAWSFYIIALFFAVGAFFLSVFALFARLGALLTGLTTGLALLFQALCASLMTVWTVQAHSVFIANGQSARLGVKAYSFTWATFACFLISTVLFCVGGSVGSSRTSSNRSYFGRKKTTRSRGSFIDPERERRMKDEYD